MKPFFIFSCLIATIMAVALPVAKPQFGFPGWFVN